MRHVIALLLIVGLCFGAQLLLGDRFADEVSSRTAAVAGGAEEAAIGFWHAARAAGKPAQQAATPAADSGPPLGWGMNLASLAAVRSGPPSEQMQRAYLAAAGWMRGFNIGETPRLARQIPASDTANGVAAALRWLVSQPIPKDTGSTPADGFAWKPPSPADIVDLSASAPADIAILDGPAPDRSRPGGGLAIGAPISCLDLGAWLADRAVAVMPLAAAQGLAALSCTAILAWHGLGTAFSGPRLPILAALVTGRFSGPALRFL